MAVIPAFAGMTAKGSGNVHATRCHHQLLTADSSVWNMLSAVLITCAAAW